MSTPDFWSPLRATTQARIGLGRAGDALPTRDVLELRSAHAEARDAVHLPHDAERLESGLAALGLEVHRVRSRAEDRATYLRRPDLGRSPETLDHLPSAAPGTHDVGLLLADGLSARALDDHALPLVEALLPRLGEAGLGLAPVVLAEQARVGLGDHVGRHLGVATLVVVIGERPGLSVASSLGLYLTHDPRPGRRDSERNCISNVHPPDGLGYDDAADVLLRLVTGARELGESGVRLKDAGAAAVHRSETPGID
ncbi:ethanolamine ammonia-lyase subunit EutC [Nocardioides sp.]|uniref:ethanolamine ammonia-lyase subunit EutC n=1 Tax=Nocardioides sp. TaxID=35761 RepID=UPI002727301F|nr:ethanolamine ammonia-lyase subunit EutC [Nocardioides sp.]MDO9454904.1 ethanolamine ammonia-lyase subunit EutC [Nocardioides sp.]